MYTVVWPDCSTDPERVWVLDGGIIFTLENGQELTFAWNKEVELMDMQFCEPTALLGDLDFYEIEEISEESTIKELKSEIEKKYSFLSSWSVIVTSGAIILLLNILNSMASRNISKYSE